MENERQLNEFMLYENLEHKFRFSYIKGWTLADGENGVIIVAMAPKRNFVENKCQNEQNCLGESYAEVFKDNLNIVCQRVASPQQFDLEMIAESSRFYLERMLADFILLYVEDTELSGIKAKHMEYSGTVDGKHHARFSQYVTIFEGRAYALTYTAQSDRFLEHLDDVTAMINLFEIVEEEKINIQA